jgi:hypothetical protein
MAVASPLLSCSRQLVYRHCYSGRGSGQDARQAASVHEFFRHLYHSVAETLPHASDIFEELNRVQVCGMCECGACVRAVRACGAYMCVWVCVSLCLRVCVCARTCSCVRSCMHASLYVCCCVCLRLCFVFVVVAVCGHMQNVLGVICVSGHPKHAFAPQTNIWTSNTRPCTTLGTC